MKRSLLNQRDFLEIELHNSSLLESTMRDEQSADVGGDDFKIDLNNIFNEKYDRSISEMQSSVHHTAQSKHYATGGHDHFTKYNKDLREKVVTDHQYGKYSPTRRTEAPPPRIDRHNKEPKESNVRITCFQTGSFFGVPRTKQLSYTCEKIDLKTSLKGQKDPESIVHRDVRYHKRFFR